MSENQGFEEFKNLSLSSNPIDDYQRLFFTKLLFKGFDDYDEAMELNVTQKTFETKYASYFYDLRKYIYTKKWSSNDKDTSSKQNSTDKKLKELRSAKQKFHCYKYRFPNVNLNANLEYDPNVFVPFDLEKTLGSKRIIKGDISCHRKTNKKVKISKSQQEKSLPISNGSHSSQTIDSETDYDTSLDVTNHESDEMTLTDECFALNDTNQVLWCEDSGHVFFTGIWRLYQDVVKTLVSNSRIDVKTDINGINDDATNFVSATKISRTNIKTILAIAFAGNELQKSSISYEEQYEKKKQNEAFQGCFWASIDNNNNTKYIDFPWNTISETLENFVLQKYMSGLNSDQILSDEEQEAVKLENFVKRIRGGYLALQGTWIPVEIAKNLCLRFCYPIRYFLVPLFGVSFPSECEEMYRRLINSNNIVSFNTELEILKFEFESESKTVNNTQLKRKSESDIMCPKSKRYKCVRKETKNRSTSISEPNEIFRNIFTRSSPFDTFKRHTIENTFFTKPSFVDYNAFQRRVSVIPSLKMRSRSISWDPSTTTITNTRKISNEKLPSIDTIVNKVRLRTGHYIFDSNHRESVTLHKIHPYLDVTNPNNERQSVIPTELPESRNLSKDSTKSIDKNECDVCNSIPAYPVSQISEKICITRRINKTDDKLLQRPKFRNVFC